MPPGPSLRSRSGAWRSDARALDQRDHLDRDLRIDAAPEHERRQRFQSLVAEYQRARDGPRPQQGGALPEPAE
jgi:hypothetical protein